MLSPHLSDLDEHNKLSTKDPGWKKGGKGHAKHSLKGKEETVFPIYNLGDLGVLEVNLIRC